MNTTVLPDASRQQLPEEASGKSIFWALMALAFYAMTQRSTVTPHLEDFAESLWPQRSSPLICLVDTVTDCRAVLRRSTGHDGNDSVLTRGRSLPPTAFVWRLCGFVFGALPQAIKLFSMRGIPVTQAIAVAFLVSSCCGLLIGGARGASPVGEVEKKTKKTEGIRETVALSAEVDLEDDLALIEKTRNQETLLWTAALHLAAISNVWLAILPLLVASAQPSEHTSNTLLFAWDSCQIAMTVMVLHEILVRPMGISPVGIGFTYWSHLVLWLFSSIVAAWREDLQAGSSLPSFVRRNTPGLAAVIILMGAFLAFACALHASAALAIRFMMLRVETSQSYEHSFPSQPAISSVLEIFESPASPSADGSVVSADANPNYLIKAKGIPVSMVEDIMKQIAQAKKLQKTAKSPQCVSGASAQGDAIAGEELQVNGRTTDSSSDAEASVASCDSASSEGPSPSQAAGITVDDALGRLGIDCTRDSSDRAPAEDPLPASPELPRPALVKPKQTSSIQHNQQQISPQTSNTTVRSPAITTPYQVDEPAKSAARIIARDIWLVLRRMFGAVFHSWGRFYILTPFRILSRIYWRYYVQSWTAFAMTNIATAAVYYLLVFDGEGTSSPSWNSILG